MRPEHLLETLLRNYAHLRVLKTLAASSRPLTAYMVAKQSGVSRARVSQILKVLEDHGWVVRTEYRPASYQLNTEKKEVVKLVDLFSETGYLYSR